MSLISATVRTRIQVFVPLTVGEQSRWMVYFLLKELEWDALAVDNRVGSSWEGVSLLTSHTLYPNSGSAFKSSERWLIQRPKKTMKQFMGKERYSLLTATEWCRMLRDVNNVEFCRCPLQLPQLKKKKDDFFFWDDHRVFTLTSVRRGPCLLDWAIGRGRFTITNCSDSWWLEELWCVSLANTCPFGSGKLLPWWLTQ